MLVVQLTAVRFEGVFEDGTQPVFEDGIEV